MTIEKTPEQLRDDEIQRRTLEAAAKALEARSGNKLYMRAWEIGAEVIRSMKPF